MKISIITASYNSERTIADTIESVLAQTYKDIEYLIVDGASTDKTMEIARSYEIRFNGRMRIISEPDKGIYDAMNKGIAMATGDIVGILNSDDFYKDPDVLASISKAFEDNDVDCVYGNLEFVDSTDTSKVVRTWHGSQHYPGAFLKGWHPAHPTFYARKCCYERYGGFDITLNVSADYELMLRLIERHKLRNMFLDKCMVCMRYGGESTGSISKIVEGNRNVLKALQKNGFKTPPQLIFFLKRLSPKAWNMIKTKIKNIIR